MADLNLKFKNGFPLNLEATLKRHGFKFKTLVYNKYIVFTKTVPDRKVDLQQQSLPFVPLTPSDKVILLRKCQKIKESFYDPKKSAAMIRFRISEMAKILGREHVLWCEGWVERNIDPL